MAVKLIHKGKSSTIVYEVVTEIPVGYTIWNIGSNAPKGYLPLCRLAHLQPFPGACQIEVDTLKAIRLKEAETVLTAVGYGGHGTVAEMEEFVRIHKNSTSPFILGQVNMYRKAIAVLLRVKGYQNLKQCLQCGHVNLAQRKYRIGAICPNRRKEGEYEES